MAVHERILIRPEHYDCRFAVIDQKTGERLIQFDVPGTLAAGDTITLAIPPFRLSRA